MKYILTATVILFSILGYSQSPAKSRIQSFLADLKNQKWTYEKMYANHMQFAIDSMKLDTEIKAAYTNRMEFISKYLITNKVDISTLLIKRDDKTKYNSYPGSHTYIANDSAKRITWYFLLNKENKIRSILRFNKGEDMFIVY